MTELEQASIDAFNDLVAHGGKPLLVSTKLVQGLVQLIEPEDAKYTLEDGEGQDGIVKVLKTSWPSGYSRKGNGFEITDKFKFRIKTVRSDTLFWHFRCEVTPL